MEFLSKPEIIQSSAVQLYTLLCDYEQFGSMLPPSIQDWTVTENGCRFNLNSMTECTLKLSEKKPYSRVTYFIDSDKHFSANVVFLITEEDNHCALQMRVSANVPLFMRRWILKPIEQAMDFAMLQIKHSIHSV